MPHDRTLRFDTTPGRGPLHLICLPGLVPDGPETYLRQLHLLRAHGTVAVATYPYQRFDLDGVLASIATRIRQAHASGAHVLFAGCGETTTGEKGHVLRTTDYGETWQALRLPVQPNATIWGLATHPADANRILAFSLFGEVYISDDAGDSWHKIAREFGEIRAAAWLPN